MAAITMVLIRLPCPECRESDSQFCRKCGGKKFLESRISKHQLARMGEIPQVLGAHVVVTAPRSKRRPVAKKAGAR